MPHARESSFQPHTLWCHTQCCRFLTTCSSLTGVAQEPCPTSSSYVSRSSSGLCREASLAPPSTFQQTQYFMLTRLAFSFGERSHKNEGSFRMPTSKEQRNQSTDSLGTAVGRRAFLHGALIVRDRNCFRKQDLESRHLHRERFCPFSFVKLRRLWDFEWSDLFCIYQPGDSLGIRSSSFSVLQPLTTQLNWIAVKGFRFLGLNRYLNTVSRARKQTSHGVPPGFLKHYNSNVSLALYLKKFMWNNCFCHLI